MPRKRPPIFRKAWDLISFSIPIEKLQKPVKQNLLHFKKERKDKRKLLKYYNHAFVEQYQFSPSRTPLFHHYQSQKAGGRSLCSMFLLCRRSSVRTVEEFDALDEPDLPLKEDVFQAEPKSENDEEFESDSVDKRAEKFIARFYEDMRMQRQESALQEYTV